MELWSASSSAALSSLCRRSASSWDLTDDPPTPLSLSMTQIPPPRQQQPRPIRRHPPLPYPSLEEFQQDLIPSDRASQRRARHRVRVVKEGWVWWW
ncbi:hypothetical protein EV2_015166 [Malus domestica]